MADYNQVIQVFWYQITSQQLPFPTSRAISSLPSGDGSIMGANVAYNDPMYAGIYLVSNNQSGGNARWVVNFTAAFAGQKIKAYVNFGNNWYVYEIQVWGPGTWTINNPGTGPALPNQIIFGVPTPIFEDFPPDERDPNFPPPTINPFEPVIIIERQGGDTCDGSDSVKVTLAQPPNLIITQVVILKDGVPYAVSIADLLAGYLFTEAGDYEMTIYYSYMGNTTEMLVRYFNVIGAVYPYIQLERTYGGTIFAQDPVVFDHTLLTNGSIDCNTLNGQISIYACGVFFIKWFIASQFSMTTDGANFAIVSDSTPNLQGSSHIRVSPTTGFTIIEVDTLPFTFQLVNISDGEFLLSNVVQASAGLVVVKIGDVLT